MNALMLRLLHHTNKPLRRIRDAKWERARGSLGVYDKPDGLWVSVDGPDSWAEWCEAEGHGLAKLTYEIELSKDARIYLISDKPGMLDFTRRYAAETPRSTMMRQQWAIDWPRLQSEGYDGIIIAPYQHECRLSVPATRWYYGWDCASGCIWNARAISIFREVT